MGIVSKTSTLSALVLSFSMAAGLAHAQGRASTYRTTDLSDIQERFEQIEKDSRLSLVPRNEDGFLDENRTISLAQERAYQQITKLLSQNGERLDLMRAQIQESMSILNPDLPKATIRQMASDWIRDYMIAETAVSQTEGHKTTMPEKFARTVRGCTQDGKIYQISYNIAADMAELGAFGNDNMPESESSMFETQVLDTNRHFSGVTGTDSYLETLGEINDSIDYSMQRLTGGLIDSISAEQINGDEYNALMTTIINSTEDGIAENYYNVDIDIIAQPAKQLPGECSPAFNNREEEHSANTAEDAPPSGRAATNYTKGSLQSSVAQNIITGNYTGTTSDDLADSTRGTMSSKDLQTHIPPSPTLPPSPF